VADDAASVRPGLTPHPLRASVLHELHARPFFAVTTPRRFLHYAFMTAPAEAAADRAVLRAICEDIGVQGPPDGARHHRVDLGPAVLRWEQHGEFTTYTWDFIGDFDSARHEPFGRVPMALIELMGLLRQPGPHMVSVDLHLIPEVDAPRLEDIFDVTSLAVSVVDQGGAMVATDFRASAEGFVRILAVDLGLTGSRAGDAGEFVLDAADGGDQALRLGPRAGALTQRLLEVETYRTLALMGLPEAQRLVPAVRRIEDELTRIAGAMAKSTGLEGDHRLLDDLTGMAAALEADSAASAYRLGASRAYDQLVTQRLNTIGEQRHGGWPTIAAFLARRLAPAIRSCQVLQDRQTDLATKLARAANLLRTRVDVAIEQQNRDLLRSMNNRTRLQLRLQQTVEGLSIAAISYYVIALLAHVLDGVDSLHVLPFNETVATALLVPLVIVGVALVVRSIRRRHTVDD
jgi:uncharacterized membrane-anchored protein